MIRIRIDTLNQILSASLCALLILSLAGCGGCNKNKENEDDTQANDETGGEDDEKLPFEFEELTVQPSQPRSDGPSRQYVKPGHWITANKPIIANDYDFKGVLDSDCVTVNGDPIPTQNTDTHLITNRSVPLAKGQWRDNEVTFYIPRRENEIRRISLRHRLRARPGSRPLFDESQPVNLLQDYQYLMVVLADNADDYGFLRATNAVVQTVDTLETGQESLVFYRVITPSIENRIPLPSQSLAWTSIAYLIWDNPDFSKFNPDQERALVDWLHFGGQLVISGPDSLLALRGSFLEDYLPAQSGEAIELTQDRLAPLNDFWSIPVAKSPAERRTLQVNNDAPMAGVELELEPAGQFVLGTGNLVAERTVGRGRVAVTSFSLDDRSLFSWESLDGFINGCILRRPNRRFGENSFGKTTFELANYDGPQLDPLMSSTLRYLSRDLTPYDLSDFAGGGSEPVRERDDNLDIRRSLDDSSSNADEGIDRYGWFLGGYRSRNDSGVAGWNDNSGISIAARDSLEESAGITPPTASFVRNTLIIYLLVLVPINWLVFRLMGKVEWAWIAAPVIAVVGAVVVVRMASLDIGFVRSRSEIAILEVHGDYPRGHLTRYTAVYSSLSSGYDFVFDDVSSQSQPFAPREFGDQVRANELREVVFQRDRGVRLNDLQVDSASVRMVHSEQMFDMGGRVRLLGSDPALMLENDTDLNLRDVGVLRRNLDGSLQVCWVGELSDHSPARRLDFRDAPHSAAELEQWNESQETLSHRKQAQLLLDRFDENNDRELSRGELQSQESILQQFESVDSRRGAARGLGSEFANDGTLTHSELELACRLSRGGVINVGAMLEMITKHLDLRRGEIRMIGWTDEELGGMQIDPPASQTMRRTLVVVHLQMPTLGAPERDVNAWLDFNAPLTTEDADLFSN